MVFVGATGGFEADGLDSVDTESSFPGLFEVEEASNFYSLKEYDEREYRSSRYSKTHF